MVGPKQKGTPGGAGVPWNERGGVGSARAGAAARARRPYRPPMAVVSPTRGMRMNRPVSLSLATTIPLSKYG